MKPSLLHLLAAAVALATVGLAVAAETELMPTRAIAALDDDSKPAHRAPVHNVQPTDQQQELAALRREVQLLRVKIDMCRDGSEKRHASSGR